MTPAVVQVIEIGYRSELIPWLFVAGVALARVIRMRPR